MSNMNDARHNIKERVRESGSNANTKICFEVRAHSSTFPPSHRRISTNSSAQDFSHREPPLRIWINTIWEYTTPLLTNTISTLRGKAQSQTISTSQMRNRHKAKQQSALTRGIELKVTTPIINLYTRGISQIRRVYNLVITKTTNNFFSHKTKILIDRIE